MNTETTVLKFNCTQCGQTLEAPPAYSSLTITCPACQAMIKVPSSDPDLKRVPEDAADDEEDAEDIAVQAHNLRVWSIALLVMGALFAIGLAAIAESSLLALWIAGPVITVFVTLRFFARLAAIHAEVCRIREQSEK